MVKLRLRRTGKKHSPSYQIVAIDSRRARDAIFLEKVGHYFPLENKVDIKRESVLKWLENGAQPTETVKSILKKQKIIKEFTEKKQKILKQKKITKNKIKENKTEQKKDIEKK